MEKELKDFSEDELKHEIAKREESQRSACLVSNCRNKARLGEVFCRTCESTYGISKNSIWSGVDQY